MTAHTDPVDHCHTHWYADVYAAANAGIPPDVHHCNRWRADHPGDHLCCCGATRPRDKATDRHQVVASSPQPPAAHLEGDTVTTTPRPVMTLADIAARCRSDALSLREAALCAAADTAIGSGKIAQQATDRANTVDALATLLDRLARVPAANSYPPYVDAAQRLARLAGVDL